MLEEHVTIADTSRAFEMTTPEKGDLLTVVECRILVIVIIIKEVK